MLTRVLLGLGAGGFLGGLYFGALWWTVRRIPDARRPALLVVLSYVTRLGVLGLGLMAVVRGGGAPALLGALLGVLAIRQLALTRVRSGPGGAVGMTRRAPGVKGAPEEAVTPDGSR